jgi:hypothetical protein
MFPLLGVGESQGGGGEGRLERRDSHGLADRSRTNEGHCFRVKRFFSLVYFLLRWTVFSQLPSMVASTVDHPLGSPSLCVDGIGATADLLLGPKWLGP